MKAAETIKTAAAAICPKQGSLAGMRIFCPDLSIEAVADCILAEQGEPVLIDAEYETWGMDPEALEAAFELYPEVRLVVVGYPYGVPSQMDEIKKLCQEHGAALIEDTTEACSATYRGKRAGSIGDFSSVFMEQQGRSYSELYAYYEDAFDDLPIYLNPYDGTASEPAFAGICATLDENALAQRAGDHGKTSPDRICKALCDAGYEAARLREPLHLQKRFDAYDFITVEGSKHNRRYANNPMIEPADVGADLFHRSIRLPVRADMDEKDVQQVAEIIAGCFE